MITRILISLMLLLFPLLLTAQTEATSDSLRTPLPELPVLPQQPLRMDEAGFLLDVDFPIVAPAHTPMDSMTFTVPTIDYTPYPLPIPRLGEGGNPFALDYNLEQNFRLNSDRYLSTYSDYNTYPTMGTMIEAGADITQLLGDRWLFTGGIYTAKYTMPSLIHGARFDAGLRGSLSYRINDWLRVRTYGQYSINGQQNSTQGYLTPIAPQSRYGMVMEFKITERVSVEAGMERIYNPMKMKWENVPVFSPIINLGKKKR